MTRSLVIINTSNWKHEDYEIIDLETNDSQQLKPGEQCMVPLYNKGALRKLKITAIELEKSVPFINKNGKQIVPVLDINWEEV